MTFDSLARELDGLAKLLVAVFLIGLITGSVFGAGAMIVIMTPATEPSGQQVTDTAPSRPETSETRTPTSNVALPAEVTLPGTWQNIGPKLVESGAIDLEKMQRLYSRRGQPLTKDQLAFFTEGSDEQIVVNTANSRFLLNVLWALGITNKNPVLSTGAMGQYVESGNAGRLASTGGWTLGATSGADLLNSAELITLTPEQQAVVNQVAKNTYRPCCNNPTAMPDCNHGAAALGLAELLAAQGASADEVANALKAVNAMWFQQRYWELATYFKEVEGTDWADVDAWTVLGKDYSSASGWQQVHTKLQEENLLPEARGGGSSCGL